MKPAWKLLPALVVAMVGNVSIAQDDKEPPLQVELEVSGKKVRASDGETVDLPKGGDRDSVTVRILPYRVFSKAGLTFRYPKDWSYSADLEDPESPTWTLSGGLMDLEVTSMPSKGNAPLEAATFFTFMATGIRAMGFKVILKPDEIVLGKQKFQGQRMSMIDADDPDDVPLVTRYFVMNSPGRLVILGIDEPDPEDEEEVASHKEVMKLLGESLKVEGK